MAAELAEPHYAQHSRLWFPEGAAPFGELNFIRPDHSFVRESVCPKDSFDAVLLDGAMDVLRDAWRESRWLQEAAGEERTAHFLQGKAYEALEQRIAGSVREAAFYGPGRSRSAWIAVRPLRELETREAGEPTPLRSQLLDCQVVALATAKHDVSGTPLQRATKRLFHPEKVYAAVSDIDVRPDQQGQRIGSAALYIMLGMFRPDQKPTTYVMAVNEELERNLQELGYRVTGSHVRDDLIPGVLIEENRLEADSVQEVRGRLLEQFPWLAAAQPVGRGTLDNY